jgi:hypothetical protein
MNTNIENMRGKARYFSSKFSIPKDEWPKFEELFGRILEHVHSKSGIPQDENNMLYSELLGRFVAFCGTDTVERVFQDISEHLDTLELSNEEYPSVFYGTLNRMFIEELYLQVVRDFCD